MSSARTESAADRIADQHLDDQVRHDPIAGTYLGIPGHDDRLPSYDPDWYEERSQLRRKALAGLTEVEPADLNDRVTVAALREQLEISEQLRELGDDESNVRNIDSPVQVIRDVFDLMPTASADHWSTIATRLAAVPESVTGYIASLRLARDRGDVRPQRQIKAAIKQCADNVGPEGFFSTFARDAATGDGALPEALHADLQRAAEQASDAYDRLARFLRDELLPAAPSRDAIGRERYIPHSRHFLGARIDPEEAYDWGQQELARIRQDMSATAERIRPGATLSQAISALDNDPKRRLPDVRALQRWMQEKADAAVAALADVHFDIPEPIRRLDCRIAPTHDGVMYYTAPSEDLQTRPGTMWWSVPQGTTAFTTWRELTTVYHEGVPGHHLQVAQTVYRRDTLNRWRRLGCWTSGYGEGWALYAERLMAELGYLDDPGEYLGMLDAQSMRAARVVIDVGVHCELPAPDEVGGGSWTYEKAFDFFSTNVNMDEGFRRYEVDRYLGWPGQAPSYKLGERYWLELREEMRQREGDAFNLKSFHRRALDLGAVGLDVLAAALHGTL